MVKQITNCLILIVLLIPQVAMSNIQDTTKVGVFVTSIYDLNYVDNSFSAQFWVWHLNKKREFKEYNIYEPNNVKQLKKTSSSTEWPDQSENVLPLKNLDTLFWDYEEYEGVFTHQYDINKYPFDKEILIMDFESSNYYDDWVKLVLDSKHSALDINISIKGWNIDEMKVEKYGSVYNTTFGSPGDSSGHVYSGFRVTIPIERNGIALFFKLFTGLAVSFFIALFSLKINISEADGRFGVCVGALFAALANMYIVNSNLPVVSQFSYMDQAHVITIFLILALFISSIYSLKYSKSGKVKKSRRLDSYAFYSILIVYLILNTVILLIALN
jgi:hypothetical protein